MYNKTGLHDPWICKACMRMYWLQEERTLSVQCRDQVCWRIDP